MQGCLKAFHEHSVSYDEATNYEPSRFSMQGGYEAARRLLKKNPGITAIFAIGDTIAIGAMRAICDLGLHVPDDISIIGYDGIEASRYTIPRLATVRQDAETLARKGVDDLLLHLKYAHHGTYEDVPFEFVEGESVVKLNH